MDKIRQLTETEVRLGFAALCIESVARRAGCTYREMHQRLHRVGLIDDFILRYYDVNHTESRQVVTDRIFECLKKREGGTPC